MDGGKVFASNVNVIRTPPVSCWGFPIRQVIDQAKTVSSTGAWPQGSRPPPGLDVLLGLNQIYIEQEMDVAEATLGREMPNKYLIRDINGQQLFTASEVGAAAGGGALRPFEIRIVNSLHQEVIRLNRPFKCNCCCCCCCCSCCFQNLAVSAPPGQLIGRIVEKWNPIRSILDIENASNSQLLRIQGPFCSSCACRNVDFNLVSPETGSVIGKIQKKWSGFLQEAVSDADNFYLTFPGDLDVITKALILGGCFLIDFMFFESSPERNDRRRRRRGAFGAY